MDRAISALLRAFASQLHPRMLALLVVPLVVAVVFWIMVGLLIWDPLTGWLASSVYDSEGISGWIWTVAATIGLKGLREFITASTALMLVLPLMAATALLIIAVFAMPLVTKHLGAGPYRDVLA
ncbi:MAG: EI24 domain-containing protein, partial [Quisquiliibacterium sp.]